MSEKVTFREVVDELNREIAMRVLIFPKWIAAGKMTEAQAERRIHLMEVARDYLLLRPGQR